MPHMSRFLAALALAASLSTAGVAVAQNRPAQQNQSHAQPARPQAQPARPAAPATTRYGSWDRKWGATPPAPPRHWTRTSAWYGHVRSCQQRYRGYNASTDTYLDRRGRRVRCPA